MVPHVLAQARGRKCGARGQTTQNRCGFLVCNFFGFAVVRLEQEKKNFANIHGLWCGVTRSLRNDRASKFKFKATPTKQPPSTSKGNFFVETEIICAVPRDSHALGGFVDVDQGLGVSRLGAPKREKRGGSGQGRQ